MATSHRAVRAGSTVSRCCPRRRVSFWGPPRQQRTVQISPAPARGAGGTDQAICKPIVVVKPETKPENKAETKPETKPEANPVTKPEPIPATKPEANPATKPETIPATIPATKPETIPVTKPATQPATTKPTTQPATKPAAKTPDTKPANNPQVKPEAEPETADMATNQLQSLLDSFEARLSTVEQSVLSTGGGGGGGGGGGSAAPMASGSRALPASGGGGGDVSASVAAFDEYCAKNLDPFVAACEKLGGAAAAAGAVVKKAWGAQRDFLVMASACKKPDPSVLGSKMAPLQACVKEAGDCRTRDSFENHTKAIGEAMGCLSWVVMYPPAGIPKDMVEPTIGGSDYWANKVRMQYRKTNPEQVEFCDALKALLTGLLAYVQANHKTGLSWNPRGGDAASYAGSAGAPSAGTRAPPAVAPRTATAAPGRPAVGGGKGLFGELSKGLAVTSGLKKVSKDQQTWRAEYKGDGAPAAVASKPAAKSFSAASKAGPKGPPKMEFVQQGMKWIVENQGAGSGVVTVEVTDKKHQVYIYGCMDATIDIKGKCKMVAIDGCKKTQVLLDDAISSVELVNCQRIKVQVRGSVPSVAVDKTDGFLCYLSEQGLSTTFVTSKSSEMNVSFPKPGTDEQMEMPIPEQFVHTVKMEPSPRITSDVSDLYSH